MLLHSKTLKKFSQIKSFEIKDVTGKKLFFTSKDKRVNVLIIMCNHCPYVVRVLPQLREYWMSLKKIFMLFYSTQMILKPSRRFPCKDA